MLSSTLILISILITTSTAIDTITTNQTIRDDDGKNSTIESAGGVFELGFFSPGRSNNRYLGIWYKKVSNRTVVWVANRESPLLDSSGVLRVDVNGSLTLRDGADNIIWSSNSTTPVTNNYNSNNPVVVAQLLDTSNFVIRYVDNSNPENYLWQSFDYPGDNWVPTMKVGWDLVKGIDRHLTSWKTPDDPSAGDYTFRVNLEGYPEMLQVLVAEGSKVVFRVGPWDGIQFSGISLNVPDLNFDLKLVLNEKQIYSEYVVPNNSRPLRLYLSPDGVIQFLTWYENIHNWTFSTYLSVLYDECDPYALCGAYGKCNITEAQSGQGACKCLAGFEPKSPERWKLAEWSDGCARRTPLTCGNGDTFVKFLHMKLPDTRNSWYNQSMSLDKCETKCRNNCSCTAYSNVEIRQGGIGCMLWFNDLLDIRDYNDNGLPLYVRTAPELEVNRSSSKKKRVNIAIILIAALGGLLLLGLILGYVYKKRKLGRRGLNPENDAGSEDKSEDLELPLIEFQIIANATNNFSQDNKLGEGGFGPVYKGTLDEGQEIAVKRLSKTSKQGLDEFKNEVKCIVKLQHRNLVRLLGCCIEEGEMLLIYEYMPNKSLDAFIFDKELSKSLDWPKRYNIINGIAKGLLYLHQDSKLRIIHRDLKADNILLDHEMSPRISDFGLARSFGGNESVVNTVRVVGTYGYMAPEYAIDGLFSVKSDAYSFGVLLLEIVSGKKIRQFYHSDSNVNLLGHAWKLYKDDKILDLIDETIVESCKSSEVLRAIHIGLLCVQPYPQDRPNMSFVVSMLDSENELPLPKQPGFFIENGMQGSDSSSQNHGAFLSNGEFTVTFSAPR